METCELNQLNIINPWNSASLRRIMNRWCRFQTISFSGEKFPNFLKPNYLTTIFPGLERKISEIWLNFQKNLKKFNRKSKLLQTSVELDNKKICTETKPENVTLEIKILVMCQKIYCHKSNNKWPNLKIPTVRVHLLQPLVKNASCHEAP